MLVLHPPIHTYVYIHCTNTHAIYILLHISEFVNVTRTYICKHYVRIIATVYFNLFYSVILLLRYSHGSQSVGGSKVLMPQWICILPADFQSPSYTPAVCDTFIESY